MGVKLSELVQKKEISLDDLRNKIIAIDSSNVIYQFLSSIRQRDGTPLMDNQQRITSHLQGLLLRTTNLLEKGIKPVFVFDGKSPLLKLAEQEAREHRKQLAEQKLEKAREEEDIISMEKYSKQTTRLTHEIVKESKLFVEYFGLSAIQAPSEAEAQAAFMCEQGDVYAVGSQDFDSLLFGAPRLIQNLTLSNKRKLPSGATVTIKPELIELNTVLETLNITQDQLIVMGILIGTDFNINGVKGVGPKNALKLVHQYKNFDILFKEVKAEFDWKKVYAIFKSMPVMKNYQLKFHDVNREKIFELLVEEHDFDGERVQKTLDRISKRESNLKKWF